MFYKERHFLEIDQDEQFYSSKLKIKGLGV
jgi:hypothetical protein